MHKTINYLNNRLEFEQPRWLPDLKKANDSIPIHILWGNQDDVAPTRVALHLKEHVCNKARLTIIKEAGHFIEQENTKEFLKEACLFWQSLKKI